MNFLGVVMWFVGMMINAIFWLVITNKRSTMTWYTGQRKEYFELKNATSYLRSFVNPNSELKAVYEIVDGVQPINED